MMNAISCFINLRVQCLKRTLVSCTKSFFNSVNNGFWAGFDRLARKQGREVSLIYRNINDSELTSLFSSKHIGIPTPINSLRLDFMVTDKTLKTAGFEYSLRPYASKVQANNFYNSIYFTWQSQLFDQAFPQPNVQCGLEVNDWDILDFALTQCKGSVRLTLFMEQEKHTLELTDYMSLHVMFFDERDYMLFKLIEPFNIREDSFD